MSKPHGKANFDNALDVICPTRGKPSRPKSGERWDDGPATLGNMIELLIDGRLNDFPKWKERHSDDITQLCRLMSAGASQENLRLSSLLLDEFANVLVNLGFVKSLNDAKNLPFDDAVKIAKTISGSFGWVASVVESKRPGKKAATPEAPVTEDVVTQGEAMATGRKPTVDERMKAELASNLEAVKGWTAQQWATKLGCGKTSIIDAETWQSLSLLRQQMKAEKRNDRNVKRPTKRRK